MRAKIMGPNLLVVLLTGLAAFCFLRHDLGDKTVERLKERIATTSFLFERSETLRGFELLSDLRQQAAAREIAQTFDKVDIEREEDESDEAFERRLHQAWFQTAYMAVETYSELRKERDGKQPELVFITDRRGRVLARNTSPQACPAGHNVAAAIPPISRALEGMGSYSLWSVDDSPLARDSGEDRLCSLKNVGLLEIAATPVYVGGEVAGVLAVGFEVSNGTARKQADQIGLDLAVLKGGGIYSSSFAVETSRQSLNAAVQQGEAAGKIAAAIDGRRFSEIIEIDVEGDPYLAMAIPVVNSEDKDRISVLVMGSLRDFTSDLATLYFILVAMIIAAVIVIVIGVVLGNHFLNPVVAIEEGLLRIINGEYGFRFDIRSSEVGGLAYRINQLISVLTGEEEDGEEDEGEAKGGQ